MQGQVYEHVKSSIGLYPVDDTGGSAVNGPVIDRQGYESGYAQILTGLISGTPTSTSMVAKVQHGDESDGSDMADVDLNADSTADFKATITTASTLTEIKITDLKALKRYIRVTQTTTFVDGSTPKVAVAAVVILGNASELPTA